MKFDIKSVLCVVAVLCVALVVILAVAVPIAKVHAASLQRDNEQLRAAIVVAKSSSRRTARLERRVALLEQSREQ